MTTIGGAPACGDDGKTTSATTATGASTGPGSSSTGTNTTTGSTTSPTTSATSTGVGTTTDTGGRACAGLPDMTTCVAEPGCVWATEFGACIVDCALSKDEASCNMQDYCTWFHETCELVVV